MVAKELSAAADNSCNHGLPIFISLTSLAFSFVPPLPHLCLADHSQTHLRPLFRLMPICPGTTGNTMWSCQSCCTALDCHFPLGSEKSFRRSAALSSPVSSSSSVHKSRKPIADRRPGSSFPLILWLTLQTTMLEEVTLNMTYKGNN